MKILFKLQFKITHSNIRAKLRNPNGIKRIPQLNSSLAHIKDEQGNAASDDGTQMFPVNFQGVPLTRFLNQHVLTGKHQPERAENSVENSLTDVTQQKHKLHLEEEREVFEGDLKMNFVIFPNFIIKICKILTIQESQSSSQINQHVLQQNWLSGQQMNAMPEPHHNCNDEREEDGFQADPNFSEATILVDYAEM